MNCLIGFRCGFVDLWSWHNNFTGIIRESFFRLNLTHTAEKKSLREMKGWVVCVGMQCMGRKIQLIMHGIHQMHPTAMQPGLSPGRHRCS